jgi:hypothetical protein
MWVMTEMPSDSGITNLFPKYMKLDHVDLLNATSTMKLP